jgi:hypothetical protein
VQGKRWEPHTSRLERSAPQPLFIAESVEVDKEVVHRQLKTRKMASSYAAALSKNIIVCLSQCRIWRARVLETCPHGRPGKQSPKWERLEGGASNGTWPRDNKTVTHITHTHARRYIRVSNSNTRAWRGEQQWRSSAGIPCLLTHLVRVEISPCKLLSYLLTSNVRLNLVSKTVYKLSFWCDLRSQNV